MSKLINIFPGIAERHYFQDPETKEFWFHATGVCNALGFQNVSRSLQSYTDEDERFQEIFEGKATWFVSEAGCYGLAMSAKNEIARKFKRWLKHEVLPKLRRTGIYVSESQFSAEEVDRIQQVVKERDDRILQLEGNLNQKRQVLMAQERHWQNYKSPTKSAIALSDRGKFAIELTASFDGYVAVKEQVRDWLEKKYSRSGIGKKAKWRSVYGLKHEFEREIGYVTHGILTLWLEEWGWKLRSTKGMTLDGTQQYDVFLASI